MLIIGWHFLMTPNDPLGNLLYTNVLCTHCASSYLMFLEIVLWLIYAHLLHLEDFEVTLQLYLEVLILDRRRC